MSRDEWIRMLLTMFVIEVVNMVLNVLMTLVSLWLMIANYRFMTTSRAYLEIIKGWAASAASDTKEAAVVARKTVEEVKQIVETGPTSSPRIDQDPDSAI